MSDAANAIMDDEDHFGPQIVGLHRALTDVAREIEDRGDREHFLDLLAQFQDALEDQGVDFSIDHVPGVH